MSTNKQEVLRPATATDEFIRETRDAKVAFFSKVFTQDQTLEHSTTIFKTIINSPDSNFLTMEQLLGTKMTALVMDDIMFCLRTGHLHT